MRTLTTAKTKTHTPTMTTMMMKTMMKKMIPSSDTASTAVFHPLSPHHLEIHTPPLHHPRDQEPMEYRYHAMTVIHLFVLLAIGVTNIKQIMKLESVIAVIPFIVKLVMKWTSVKIVERLSVEDVALCAVVSFVAVASVKTVQLHVEGKTYTLSNNVI